MGQLHILTRILLIIFADHGSCESNLETIQLFTGLHFIDRPDIIPYESAIPLLYTAEINIDTKDTNTLKNYDYCPKDLVNTDNICKLHNHIKILEDEVSKTSNSHTDYLLTPETSKQKRGIDFIGSALHWCCSVATDNQVKGLYENQQSITDHVNKVIDSIDDQYADMLKTSAGLNNLTANLNNFAKKVQSTLKIIENETHFYHDTDYLQNLEYTYAFGQRTWMNVLMNFYQDNIRDILDKCHLRTLSEKLLPKANLTTFLNSISKKAAEKQLELAIKKEHIMLYYQLPLTTCTLINQTLLVKVNIPLKVSNANYITYKVKRVPVTWKDQLCYLDLPEKLIIRTNFYTKVIYDEDKHCDTKTHPLCLVQRETLLTKLEQKCIQTILDTKPISELQKYCHYTCTDRPAYPVVTRISTNMYFVTNINEDITLECSTGSKTLTQITAGTLKLHIPCDCKLKAKDEILVTNIKPCDSIDSKFRPQPIQLIPATWSKIKSLQLFPLDSKITHDFNNLSEILDDDWSIQAPTFQLTVKQRIQHLKLKNTDYDLFTDTTFQVYILAAWVAILTFIILILIYYVHILSIKVKLQLPRRDFE